MNALRIFVLALLCAALVGVSAALVHEDQQQKQQPQPQEKEKDDQQQEKEKQQPPPPDEKDKPQPEQKEGESEKEQLDKAKEAAIDKKAEEKPKWDVNNPPAPMKTANIDTDEGTWTSVDVSPDGKEIAFDLLGDIYSMPIGGGEAKALTRGVAWDMQPRFSPDGKWIAFTSDRAGGDNLWIMKRDGSGAKQVSKESFRLLNSPAWTPDSQFLVARKHFTSRRSLGAGEMWIYHIAGGEGLQMTKRRNDQKDEGEPAISPDGRYLYFSQDATPGNIFEYNKDPNTEIYVIQRLDRKTGETEPFISGPGGAIRPTPSPDGKHLAFIRRVRYKSVLHVMDLQSGAIRPIYDGLERDMQETWAVHGVYPAMAWTPDSRSIVFWATGKIHRIDVATKQVANIPFHVKDTRQVADAVLFRQQVAGDTFPVRMLRWVEVSPKGDKVLYQALGHIYVRDLPNGTPRRLTSQTEHFEFYPAFSRDGQWVVFTTWDDQRFGSLRVVSVNGGEERVLTPEPGHYVEPAISPDGRVVVYRKIEGGFTRSPQWGLNQGVYWVPMQGGKPALIRKEASEPQFGAASDRVYLVSSENEGKRGLRSIDLDGSDDRLHLQSEDATEFRVSPDERWVAFTERFNAYIVPFVPTGKTVDISPDTKAVPIAKVSRDAGEYLHWAGDSRRLYWALGPELYWRDLKEAFAFIEGAPEKLPEPAEKGTNIGFSATYDKPEGTLALVGARIVTMRGNEIINNGTIVVEGNKIAAVGPSGSVTVPANAKRVDVKGMTIIPGLIDYHWHGAQGQDEITPEQNWTNFSSLAFGVTTIHDPSNDNSEIFAASELGKAGTIVGPRIYSTGTILYGAKAAFKAVVETAEDAQSHLRRMKAIGAFSVKSYNQPRRDQRQQIIKAARDLNMLVVPEGGSLIQHNLTMIVDGHTTIEHSIPVSGLYKDAVQLWTQSRTAYTPTLVVGYGGLWGENFWYQKTNVWENQRLLNFVPREIVDERSRRRTMAPDEEWNHFNNARIAADLFKRGVGVQIGAHGQREGLGAHWELWMLVQGGLTPHEALRAGTLSGARLLGMDAEIGSLERGKLADLVVLEKNPLENIRNSESIRYTMVNGRLYDAMKMNELGNRERARQPFYWELEQVPAAAAAGSN